MSPTKRFNYPDKAREVLDTWRGRSPDYVIGDWQDPYMQRWWVIPRNPLFNIYLHKITADDDDRACHDHPWWNVSIVLKGVLHEFRYYKGHRLLKRHRPYFRFAKTAHRLEIGRKRGELPIAEPVWTLFITGPRFRDWGFLCRRGWIHWRKFTNADNPGEIGGGCGED